DPITVPALEPGQGDHDVSTPATLEAFSHHVPLAEALRAGLVVGPPYVTPGNPPRLVMAASLPGEEGHTWVLAVELTLRPIVQRGGDEIAALGRDFNSMTVALRDRVRQLEAHGREIDALNEELRRQIGERSRDLSEALARVTAGAQPVDPEIGDVIGERYRVT